MCRVSSSTWTFARIFWIDVFISFAREYGLVGPDCLSVCSREAPPDSIFHFVLKSFPFLGIVPMSGKNTVS